MAWRKNDPSLGNDPSYLEPKITEVEDKISAIENELPNKIDNSEKGIANGVASLSAEGKVIDAYGNEVEGKVKSVNDISPDDKGNITVPTFSGNYNDLTNKPALKTVATTGSYNDLTNKPTIPTTPSGVGLSNVDNVKQMPIAGGRFTGLAYAQVNTSYTVAQLRNVILSTGNPTGGNDGDIWIKYV